MCVLHHMKKIMKIIIKELAVDIETIYAFAGDDVIKSIFKFKNLW